MNDIVNPIQNTSYTKKDFESIYTELLDIVKELTYKWDPTISNESDPGVILLKLNAIIADKCNYNIDKNVLECFPLSVTQTPNARQLFEQLGYCMKWYQGATTDVCLQYTGEYDAEYKYTIPAFTMVTDGDSNVVYTLVGPKDESGRYSLNAGDMLLPCDNSVLVSNAIQGVAVDYTISGEQLITTSMLDSNNRLYFNYTNIAENGIFIRNSDSYNYNDWVKKDNLLIEELGNTFFKFGVTQDGFNCYLEFPEDAEVLFKDGIYITYIRTDGDYGNIAYGILEKFYNDISAKGPDDSIVTLNGNNVLIKNNYKASNGKNPETINEGYHNYKKIVGTFDTLVTLRDYFNAVVNDKLGSNGFVCDRTNDIQVTYDIMSLINGLDQPTLEYEKIGDEEYPIDSFELKFYITRFVDGVTDISDYINTYQLMSKNELNSVETYLEDSKSLQHEYSYILPTIGAGTPIFLKEMLYNVGDYVTYYDSNNNPKIYKCLVKKAIGLDFNPGDFEEVSSDYRFSHYCMFKNKYSINGQITPQYELTRSQKSELLSNVYKALFEKLNSQEVDFGDEVPSDLIYTIITEADSRIKKFTYLSNIDYDTYAVYWNGFEFVETPINGDNYFPVDIKFARNGKSYFESPVVRKYDTNDKLYKWSYGKNLNITVDYDKFFEATNAPGTEASDICENRVNCTNIIASYVKGAGATTGNWNLHYKGKSLSDLGIVVTGTYTSGDRLQIGYSDGYQFRNEIYTKSVLAGKTQLFINNDEYDYRFDQQQVESDPGKPIPTNVDNIEYIKPSVTMVIDSEDSPEDNDMKYYQLKENESIQFYSPNLLEVASYSENVKFECYFHPETTAQVLLGTNYELKDGEFIIFYWKEKSEDELWHYYAYGKGNVISSTFTMSNPNSWLLGESRFYSTSIRWRNIGTVESEVLVADSVRSGLISTIRSDKCSDLNRAVNNLAEATQILSGSKKITVKKRNSIYLDHNSYYCFWTLNEIVNEKYVLFEHDFNDTKYTLGSGEYFYYTDATMSQLVILGAGTTIERLGDNTEEWSVEVINSEDILSRGISELSSYWWQIPAGNYVKVTENQFVALGTDNAVYLKENGWSAPDGWKITFTTDAVYATNRNWNIGDSPDLFPIVDSDGTNRYLKDFIIKYTMDDTLYTLDGAESENNGWEARSILNVNLSSTLQMHLLENQSITYKRIDNEEEETITGKSFVNGGIESQSYYPVCIVGSIPISSDGSDKSVTYVEEADGTLTYLSLYLFKTVGDWDDIIYRVDGGVALYFRKGGDPEEEQTKSFDFCVPAGKYVVSVKNVYPYLTGGSVKLDGVDVKLVNSDKIIDFTKTGTWAVELIIDSYSTHTLSVSISGHQGYQDTIIVLGDLYAYSVPEDMTEDTFAIYNRLINKFDFNDKYDYNYIVDEDLNISDPLRAETFFYTTHIYNKFTISAIDISRLNVTLAGKK